MVSVLAHARNKHSARKQRFTVRGCHRWDVWLYPEYMLIVMLAPPVQWGIGLAYCSGFLPWLSRPQTQITSKYEDGVVTDFPHVDVIHHGSGWMS